MMDMRKLMNRERINFIPINKIKGLPFVVKDYQRGYKWQEEQINALLNDINKHENGKYCLQPVIVDSSSEGIELIDGQQRVTTIYLLLYYLEQKKYYTIDYRTRKNTELFLNGQMALVYNAIKNNTAWLDFLKEQENEKFDNVDIYHIYHVLEHIANWFKDKQEIKEQFIQKIKEQIYIIWYDVSDNPFNKSAEDIFLDLNAGKIALTNSELIKALFVLDTQNQYPKEISELKSYEITNEWDLMENQLQDDSFWFFLNDHNYYNSIDTRIDFIIDLANEIAPSKNWDGKESYRIYEKKYLQEPLDWSKIKQTFNKLFEWYSDTKNKEIYHYIGFLVNAKILNLTKILKMSIGNNKNEFKDKLLQAIKKELKKEKKKADKSIRCYDLEILNYEDYRMECQNILLLLNVEQFINDRSSNKFPFDLYKKELWSVEHINPQNPKEFENVGAIIKWLNTFKNYLDNSDEISVTEIEEVLRILENEDKLKRIPEIRLKTEQNNLIVLVFDKITDLLNLHHITNLALLDKNTNSKLGNKIFIDKRTELLKLYFEAKQEKVFIPECTKDVFTKNYSESKESIMEELFGLEDMDGYKAHIKKRLSKFYQTE